MAVRPDLGAPLPVDQQETPPDVPQDTAVQTNGPSLWQKAKNLSGAIVDHVAAGLPHADDKTIEHRLEVCHTCEHFDTAYSRCRKCGCNMPIKVRWAEQRCPVGKW